MKKNWYLMFGVLALLVVNPWISTLEAQAILGSAGDGNLAVIFPTPTQNLPTPAQIFVSNLPSGASPHGVAYYGTNNALISDFGNSRVFVVQISTATVAATINTSSAGYTGTGTIAVSPSLKYALAAGAATSSETSSNLCVISAPFDAAAQVAAVPLPGAIKSWQTQAIVFDAEGTAFVYHTGGVSVLNPPYASVAFTIPVTDNSNSGAIAITPDGSKLLTTRFGNEILVFSAPFTATSSPEIIEISGTNLGLDGIIVVPDGRTALVCGAWAPKIFSIKAPYDQSSAYEEIPLPTALKINPNWGFEDIGISADGQLAIVTGNSPDTSTPVNHFPAAFIKAPFTATEARVYAVAISNGPALGRGAGAVRFLPPGLAPGLTITSTASISGSTIVYTIKYSNTGTLSVNNVVIRHPIPEGTTYISSSNGGTNVNNLVQWQITSVPAGALGIITLTVQMNGMGPIQTVKYSIEGDGIAAISGPPINGTVFFLGHLALNDIWRTTLTYINNSSQTVTCNTHFFNDTGTPLSVVFPDKPGANRTDILSPGGVLHVQTDAKPGTALQTGWAQCECDGPVKANVIFRDYKGSAPQAEGGVNAALKGSTRFVTFAEQWTGIALANPFPADATVNVTLKNSAGSVIGSKEISLPSGSHTSYSVKNLIDLTSYPNFSGSVIITSNNPIISFSLNAEALPIFSALPPGED